METKFLTEEEKATSHKKVYTFQALNGMAFNFMGQTPVYLMAIIFGASNIQLGYISSAVFLSGFILVFLPRLLAGKNLVKVQSTAWLLRGLFVLIYLALYFLEGRAAIYLILTVYTLFCGARIIGVVIWNPLIKMITTSGNRGIILAQGNIANQSASVISKLISFIITSFKLLSGTTGLLLLQVFGVIFNTLAALQLRKIPCRETVEYHKSENLFTIAIKSLKSRQKRYPLLARWVTFCVMVLNGLTIVFLRKEVGFTASYVFLYTMVIALASISAGLFVKNFSDRIGSRPLLIGISILLSLSIIIWIVLPTGRGTVLPTYIFFILGFITNFLILSNNLLIDRVLVNTMPEENAFGDNSMINFITAFFSLVTGISGGMLIDKGQLLGMFLPNNFSLMFILSLVLSLIIMTLSLKIIDTGSLSAKETVAILFSPEGLKAYSYIGKLNSTEDPVKTKTIILSMSKNNSNIATEEMRSILASPLSPHKGEVIKSLLNNPRVSLIPEILKEASDLGSYHRLKAIFALGAYPSEEVQNFLISLLDDSDPSIRSNAAKSLGRIGYKQNISKIRQLSLNTNDAMDKMNYLIALKNMDESGQVFAETFNYPREYSEGLFRQTYYSLVSDLFGFKPKLSTIYASRNQRKGDGLEDFLNSTRDINLFNNSHNDLILWFKTSNKDEIWRFCQKALAKNNLEINSPINSLRLAINNEAENRIQDSNSDLLYDDALAALYFTYQILMGNKL